MMPSLEIRPGYKISLFNVLLAGLMFLILPFPIMIIEGTCVTQGEEKTCGYDNKLAFESGGMMVARTLGEDEICFGFVCKVSDVPLTNLLYVILGSYLVAGTFSFLYKRWKHIDEYE